MSVLIIVGAAVVIYLCRVSGFLLHKRLTASWDRRLSFVPIGVFSALIVTSVMGQSDHISARILALMAGSIVVARTRRMALGIALGLTIFWILSALYT
jgi:branched-subunit amino acid transport protein